VFFIVAPFGPSPLPGQQFVPASGTKFLERVDVIEVVRLGDFAYLIVDGRQESSHFGREKRPRCWLRNVTGGVAEAAVA